MKHDTDMKRLFLFIVLSILIWTICPAVNKEQYISHVETFINNRDFESALEVLNKLEPYGYDSVFMSLNPTLLYDFSHFLGKKGKTTVYIEVAQQLLGIMEQHGGKDTPEYTYVLSKLGEQYLHIGKYTQAEAYLLKSLAIQRNLLGEEHIEFQKTLKVLGETYRIKADYSNAEQCFVELLQILNGLGKAESGNYAIILSDLGLTYRDQGKYTESILNLSQALRIAEQNENVKYTITCLNNLGLTYSDVGDYTNSEKNYCRAIELYKMNMGDNDYNIGVYCNNLGLLYVSIGKYREAKEYYIKTKDIFRTLLGERHHDYGVLLSNMAIMYERMDDYNMAEKYYLQVLDIFTEAIGEKHPQYILALCNIGRFYDVTGDYQKAEESYMKVLRLCEETMGEGNPQYDLYLHNLGSLYVRMAKYDLAEHYMLKALEVRGKKYGEQSYDYARTLISIGTLYSTQEKYDQALTAYQKATEIVKSKFGEQHPFYANLLNHNAYMSKKMGDVTSAEQDYLKALEIFKNTWGENNADYRASLSSLGTFYYDMQDYAQSAAYFVPLAQFNKSLFQRSIEYMSEKQRDAYWKSMKHYYEYHFPRLSYHLYDSQHAISTFAYDNELFTKGLLLTSSNTIRRSVLESRDSILINQWHELSTKQQQIAVLEARHEKQEYREQLQSEAEALEKEITRSSAAYRENMRQWTITWDSVRAVLKPSHVAIEYMSAPLNDDTTMYCALLLRDTCSYPIMIPLFEEKEIKGLKDADLSQKIWHNVLPYMNAGETVFFSPTGVLHQIAIENLPYDDDRTMGDVYEMVRLSSTRELAMHRTPVKHSSATLYGGIYYQEMDSVTMRQISEQYRTRDMSYEPLMANDTTQRALPKYLPGTQKEIDSIQPILTKRHIAVKLHSKRDACEESVKALSGKKQNIIHLATHGFFWQNTTQSTDPMERCGLLFAGANTALSGHNERLAAGVDDGILTAKEISLLDLRDADVVVLSACETALGDITGEGVFGLQRAFKMAGARTILMALWKVNDDATRMLMTAFYRNYSKGQTKRAAFRNAQQEVRTFTRTETRPVENTSAAGKDKMRKGQSSPITTETITTQPYKDPYFWAGFILLD